MGNDEEASVQVQDSAHAPPLVADHRRRRRHLPLPDTTPGHRIVSMKEIRFFTRFGDFSTLKCLADRPLRIARWGQCCLAVRCSCSLPTPSLPFSAAVCTGLSSDVYETDVLCQDMVFSEFSIKRKVRRQKRLCLDSPLFHNLPASVV